MYGKCSKTHHHNFEHKKGPSEFKEMCQKDFLRILEYLP